ncbi:hypothetical protein Tco_0585517 [Tanacetum coccineum]
MQVQEQNVEIKVKSFGLTCLGDVTFEQLMDEYDKKQSVAKEDSESPYETESEIKFIKSFRTEEAVANNILDEMVDLKASANKPSDPLGHLRAEVFSLSNKVDNLESSLACVKCGSMLDKGDVNIQDLVNLMKDMVYLFDSASVFRKANAEGREGEQQLNNDETAKCLERTAICARNHKDESKNKGIATEENPMKDLIPLMEKGGSALQMLNLNQFSISSKKMTLEDAQAQLAEMKRLADLKAKQEKTDKNLKKLSPAEI